MQIFNLLVQTASGNTNVPLLSGQTLFVLGANGTGKSSLMQRFAQNTQGSSKRITASRQTWLTSSALEFSPSQKGQLEQQARNWDTNQQSRWMEQNAQFRSGLTLYDLIDAENVEARGIAGAVRSGNTDLAIELARKTAPLAKINELFAQSNIPIVITVEGGDRLTASKNGSAPYGAAELSDGERNALLIAADVLTAKEGTLLIIDEPERHLHRSIISPLLTHLFRARPQCAFVVATHDLMLPVDNPDAQVLLVRSCVYSGSYAQSWEVDLVPADVDVDEALKQDIVGARRKILFVEGDDNSLDAPLYTILFPDVSVRAKGSSRNVQQAVAGIRASNGLHWVTAWGVIDSDGRDADTIAALREEGVFALPFYSVESIYYHPEIVRLVSLRYAGIFGDDGQAIALEAVTAAIEAIKPHLTRLASSAVEKAIRRQIFGHFPTLTTIQERRPISVSVDTGAIVDEEVARLEAAAAVGDWKYILSRCPIRTTPARDEISRVVGMQNKNQYETAVLQMLRENPDALSMARSFFGPLLGAISV